MIENKDCKIHGIVKHRYVSGGVKRPMRWQCAKCVVVRQMRLRRQRKTHLVELAGGKCILCGYDKWVFAIDFHHIDPSKKIFEIGKTITHNLQIVLEELEKCIPLCRNCHAEYESGCPDTIAKFESWYASQMCGVAEPDCESGARKSVRVRFSSHTLNKAEGNQ